MLGYDRVEALHHVLASIAQRAHLGEDLLAVAAVGVVVVGHVEAVVGLLLLYKGLELLEVGTHERHTIGLVAVGHHAYVVDERHELDDRLHLVERDVLAAGQLDQVLLAVDDAQVSAGQHLANVAGGEVAHAVYVREVLARLLGHVVVAESDALAADEYLAARIRLVRRPVAGLDPVDQPYLAARHHAAHRLRVGLIGQLGGAGAARLRQAVRLTRRRDTHLRELLHLFAEQCAACQDVAHAAAESGRAEAVEEYGVEQMRAAVRLEGGELLRIGAREYHLKEPAALAQALVDDLAHALEHDRYGRHKCRLEHSQVAHLALLNARRGI